MTLNHLRPHPLVTVLMLTLVLGTTACAKGDAEAPAEVTTQATKTTEEATAAAAPSATAKASSAPVKVQVAAVTEAVDTPKVTGHAPKAVKAPVGPIPKDAVEVEASCGQCNFGLNEPPGCDLAVRIDGNAYFVDGSKLDDHGDAHARRGMCNVVRRAAVTGKVVDNRYQATSFRIVD
ncbi:MAG: DUF6370 family protein [Myxococcota bacterium]